MIHRFVSVPIHALLSLALVLGVSSAVMAEEQETPSLYDRLGGLMPISVVVSEFIDEMVVDEQLNQNPQIDAARKTVPAAYLKYHVTAMVCQATGGPCEYTGRDMGSSHAHLNISESDWDRMVEILVGVLDRHGVPAPEQEELMAILASTKPEIVTAKSGR